MKRILLLAASLFAALVLACGGPKETAPSEGQPDSGGGLTSSAMVVPNTFMTYDGQKYRLVEVLQANLLDDKAFRRIGATQQADIDFAGSLDVFRRAGDSSGRYTFSKGQGTGEAAVPATWLHWTPAN